MKKEVEVSNDVGNYTHLTTMPISYANELRKLSDERGSSVSEEIRRGIRILIELERMKQDGTEFYSRTSEIKLVLLSFNLFSNSLFNSFGRFSFPFPKSRGSQNRYG